MVIHEDADLIPGVLSPEIAEKYFNLLMAEIPWQSTLKTIDGSEKKLKRQMAYAYDRVVEYQFGNFTLPGIAWTPTLLELKEIVEKTLDIKFNSVLLNRYDDGKDEIKWHSDKEEQLGDNPVIGCLNLGSTRKFHFIKKSENKTDSVKMFCELSAGDLLVMKENCQKNWLHAILPEKEIKTPRISLTFRWVHDEKF